MQLQVTQQNIYYIGQNIDVLDTVNKWLNAQVVKITQNQIFVHYTGWSYKYDQWINKRSNRILIQWEPGLNISINNRIDVFQQQIGWLQARVIDKKQNQIKIHFNKYHSKYDTWVNINNKNKVVEIGKYSKAYGVGKKKHRQSQKITEFILERLKNEIQSFKKNLKNQNLFIKEIDGDGNCLFRSISDQLYGDQKYHKEIRQLCIDYIESERIFFQNYVAGEFNLYIKRKRMDGVWGDDVQIQAISQIYNRPIQIFANGIKPIRTFHEESQNNSDPIKLAYLGRCHYNSIKDIKKLNEGTMKTQFGYYQKKFLENYKLFKEQQQIYRNQFISKAPLEEAINESLNVQIQMKQIQDINNQIIKKQDMEIMLNEIQEAEIKQIKIKQQQQKIQQQIRMIQQREIQEIKKKSAIESKEQWIQNIRQQGFLDDQILMAINAKGNDPNAVLNYLYDNF